MHPNTSKQPKRALIVEDDPTQAELTKVLLERPTGEMGGTTHTSCCVNGQWVTAWADCLGTAASMLRHNEYDVVILDMILPDGSREDAVRVVREAAPDVCIVAQSSLTDAALVRKLICGGLVSDYLAKGDITTPAALKQRVCHAIDVHNLSRDIDLEKRGLCGLA